MHCHECALVTSSSHVLGSRAGDEIDRTECVIRMNDAPTTGYESDVGNRTTLRVVAHSSVFRVVRRPNEFLRHTDSHPVIIFWGPPNKIGKDSKGTLYRLIQRVSMTYRDFSCFTVTPSKMRRFDSLFQRETGRDRWVLRVVIKCFDKCNQMLISYIFIFSSQTKISLVVEHRLVHNGHSHWNMW